MEYRTLEISLQQAKDLQNVNMFSKMDVYAVVSISGGDKNFKQKIKSPVDHDGGSNPTWNFPMKFTLEESALQQNRLTLDFKLICERALGDKDIGEVLVPIKELLDSPVKGGPDGKNFVSYQVRKPSGRPRGQLTFSYQFNEKIAGTVVANLPTAPLYPAANLHTAPVYPPENLPSGKDNGDAVMAYPAGPSSGYQVSGGYYPPPQSGYPPPPQFGYGYPPQQPGYGYPPPQPGYGYPPPQPGYGYPPPPAPGYGYPPPPGYGGYPPQVVQPPRKQNKMGLGLGAGLLGGALGGLLIGDMISDGGAFDCGGF